MKGFESQAQSDIVLELFCRQERVVVCRGGYREPGSGLLAAFGAELLDPRSSLVERLQAFLISLLKLNLPVVALIAGHRLVGLEAEGMFLRG